jgi:lipopolysaccharide transport system ATP-binding protein
MASQRATKVAMVGTFDLANYGDLLLPLIAAHELGRRLGSAYEPTLYSYRPMSSRSWPYEVRPLARLRDEISKFELLLVGGGQLIRFDRAFPDGYGPSDARVHHPLGLWLTPMLLAAAAAVPIAWNAPGVAADIPSWLDPLIAAGVAASGYLAVRDVTSAELLQERVSRAPVRIVPDSGFGAAQLLDGDTARRFEEVMQDLDSATDGYVLVQPSEELREFSGAIRGVISAARDRGLAVLEVPFSPVHGDRVGSLGALGDTLSLPEWPDPLLLTELVCRAQAVVAQSYHAGAVALGAGVPLYRPKSPRGWKYEALEVDGVHLLSEGKRGEASGLSFGRAEPTEASRERAAQVESHWDEVAGVIRRETSPVPSEPTLSLMEGIAGELHADAEATARRESVLLDRIGELEQDRADAVAWAERVGEELRGAAQALELTASERATLLAQLEERERELHGARAVMDSVWRSPSWRLTRPLRFVKSLARGGAAR